MLIFVLTIAVVGIFGVVPLPDYSIEINEEIDGKIYYQSSIISSNIIPPAPDLIDICIFEIVINKNIIKEREVLCNSDLLSYSTLYSFSTTLNEEGNLVVIYWNDSTNSEYALEINPDNKEILKEYAVENVANRNQNINTYNEVLIDTWRIVEDSDRSVNIYFRRGTETVEVFKSEAPSSYFFNSLIWSYDSEKILALDSENQFIIFSKNNLFKPFKLSYSIDEKERDNLYLIKWVKP